MPELVAGFVVPHLPLMLAAPSLAKAQQAQSCWDAYAKVMQRVRELEVDTIIIIGDDHYTLFGPHCIPAFLVGIGEVDGPAERMLNTQKTRIQNNEPLAAHILNHGRHSGVDWAVAKAITVDHSIFVPWYYGIKPLVNVKTIPVYVNSGILPLVTNKRCYEVGVSIAAAIRTWDGAGRIAIYATGGTSHWPGMEQWDKLNPEYDASVIKMLETGNTDAIIRLTDSEVFQEGGNGCWEIKNWICMLGAFPGWNPKLICYEATYEWLGTCAFMEMHRAA